MCIRDRVITAALVGNFASVFAWLMTSAEATEAQQKTELRATVKAGKHKIDKARTGQVVTRTIGDIQRQLPAAVDGMAARNSTQYVEATLQRGAPVEAAASANGHGGPVVNPTQGGRP